MTDTATKEPATDKVWSVGVQIGATLYVRGATAEEAASRARDFVAGGTIEVDGAEIYGGRYKPDMPTASLSPAMTIETPDDAADGQAITMHDMELVEDLEVPAAEPKPAIPA